MEHCFMKSVELEAPRLNRREDNLASKISVLTHTSPLQTLEMVRRMVWARWSLRKATSVGKYVKLVGRLRVANDGRLTIGDRVLLHANVATTELAVVKG